MIDNRILIVGAGPAGLSAAASLGQAGQQVLVVDQAAKPGGAVYATPRNDHGQVSRELHKARRALIEAVQACGNAIEIRCSTRFVGLDQTGDALITGSSGQNGVLFHPRAVIMATGARELVQPRAGWTHAAVTTVGALQINLKTAGQYPEGRIVLAGSGALLYACGAQLARAGNAPVAIIEAGRPFSHPFKSLRLPISYLKEAAGYMARLHIARVPIITGADVVAIKDTGSGLSLRVANKGGIKEIQADHLGLHDGLACNDYGHAAVSSVPVVSAGDSREVLGRVAAVVDGKRAANEVLKQLGNKGLVAVLNLSRQRRAQRLLADIFAHSGRARLQSLADDTVICCCENRTLADLRRATDSPTPLAQPTARSIRLNGRFGMGPCQGRFCLDWVAAIAQASPDSNTIRGQRWPVRPILVADILNATDSNGGQDKPMLRSTT